MLLSAVCRQCSCFRTLPWPCRWARCPAAAASAARDHSARRRYPAACPGSERTGLGRGSCWLWGSLRWSWGVLSWRWASRLWRSPRPPESGIHARSGQDFRWVQEWVTNQKTGFKDQRWSIVPSKKKEHKEVDIIWTASERLFLSIWGEFSLVLWVQLHQFGDIPAQMFRFFIWALFQGGFCKYSWTCTSLISYQNLEQSLSINYRGSMQGMSAGVRGGLCHKAHLCCTGLCGCDADLKTIEPLSRCLL